ncbi:MAG: hypothetical protein LBQ31_07455 [Bacteroidales bacterium]|jgi:hypothetical protein|nr:hypothetical protein [Bacteroidales bacterium]
MKKTILLKTIMLLCIFFFLVVQCATATEKENIAQEHIEKIKELLQQKSTSFKPTASFTIRGILPLKKLALQTSFYKNVATNNTDAWVILVSAKNGKTYLYKYSLQKPNSISSLSCECMENIENIFNKDSVLISYFLDKDEDNWMRLHPDYFFFVTYNGGELRLQDLCTDAAHTVDSMIILRYGSFEKYIEFLQEEEGSKLIWLETPRTLKEAYDVLRRDYRQYFECYPEDTATAITMLIEEVSNVAHITFAQRQLLEKKIHKSLYWESDAMNFTLRIGSNDVCIGKGLCFEELVKEVLTKPQMDIYLPYYEKQMTIRRRVRYGLFGIIGKFPEPVIRWDNYTKHKDKYVDYKDFLRKEVYKK